MIRVLDDGGVAIEDADGWARAVIREGEGGPTAILLDTQGRPSAVLLFSPADGELVAALTDSAGVPRTGIKIADNFPVVCTWDCNGKPLTIRSLEDPPVKRPDLPTISPN